MATNMLNSVLLEGIVRVKPLTMRKSPYLVLFEVESKRRPTNLDDDISKLEVYTFEVEAAGELGMETVKILGKGSGVRIVGRLRQEMAEVEGSPDDIYSRVVVVAEHIEIKPTRRR